MRAFADAIVLAGQGVSQPPLKAFQGFQASRTIMENIK